MNKQLTISVLLGSALSCSVVANADTLSWPYNQSTEINFSQSDIETSYQVWKSEMIFSNNAGGNGRYRVKFGDNAGQSVSEGIAYGMILTSLFDEQTEFDGLWLFAKDHFDENNVMHWKIGAPGEILGEGGATDAEVDMAIALINACVKTNNAVWSASSMNLDYCADAHALIENIYEYEVDKPGSEPYSGQEDNLGNELIPGDTWYTVETYPDGIVNLSYFAPGYFRVFGKFTGQEDKWDAVIDRNYDIANLAQNKDGNCSNLISNWNTYEGDPQVVSWQGDSSRYWGWDGARFAWRVAVDAMWYSDAEAQTTTNELASFFASVGMDDMGVEYSLNGQRNQSYNHMFFNANAASSIVAATEITPVTCGDAQGQIRSTAQQAYDKVVQDGANGGYYGGYWRLISMMLMSGNFPNLYELANGSTGLSIVMTSPSEGDLFPSGSAVTLSAQTNQDDSVSSVKFYVDGQLAGEDLSAPFSIGVSAISDGEHSASALATNTDQETATSDSVSFTLGNALPVAVATLSNTQGLTIEVSAAQSSDEDGDLVSYQWDFGDGATGTGVDATHTYGESGSYNVTLTVTDSSGATATDALTVTVRVGGSATLDCTYSISSEWPTGYNGAVTLENNTSEAIEGWEVSWSYEDGTVLTNGWSANFSGETDITVTPLSWNSTIAAGQSVSFGFSANKGVVGVDAIIPELGGASCQ